MTPHLQTPAPHPADPAMPEQKMVFEQTIEGLFLRGLGDRLTPACRSRLRQAGLDLDGKLLPAYEFEKWMAFLRIAAEELFPDHTTEVAMFRLGERTVDGFQDTFMGRAVLAMARVIGPVRTLQRCDRNFRSGNNYTTSRLKALSANCYELWVNEVGPYPTFTGGIVCAALRVAGAKEPRAEVLAHDGHACTFRITWS